MKGGEDTSRAQMSVEAAASDLADLSAAVDRLCALVNELLAGGRVCQSQFTTAEAAITMTHYRADKAVEKMRNAGGLLIGLS